MDASHDETASRFVIDQERRKPTCGLLARKQSTDLLSNRLKGWALTNKFGEHVHLEPM